MQGRGPVNLVASGTATTQQNLKSSLGVTVSSLNKAIGSGTATLARCSRDRPLTLLTGTKNVDISEAAVLAAILSR